VTILLVVGIVLIAFGGVVLLLFPDRPGGRVAWQGFEVSSVGAGLPLIVVGLAAVAFVATRGSNVGGPTPAVASRGDNSSVASGCLRQVFRGIPAARIARIEDGANDKVVARPDQGLSEPVGLRLTESGKTIGAIVANYVPANNIFKITAAVDAHCAELSDLKDLYRPSQNPRSPIGWDMLSLQLAGHAYDFELGSSPSIEVTFNRARR
jgi:hypothetical protein